MVGRVIRTVTLSPGFDHEVRVDRIDPGEVGRVMSWRVRAAGKGMNVARFVETLGAEAHAYSLVGAFDEGRFREAAAADGVRVDTFAVPGQARDNLYAHERDPRSDGGARQRTETRRSSVGSS